ADLLKQIKRANKELETVLASQVLRIERILLDDRSWTQQLWRERYLDHPLVSHIARKLIWQIEGSPDTFIWRDGKFIDSSEKPVMLSPDARVKLWHPMSSLADDVQAWRQLLLKHEIVQPFKQAYREVYILTDAERATRTHSNRFAAHILRQHQFQ